MRARVPNFVSNGSTPNGFNNNNNGNKKSAMGGATKENYHQMNGGVKGKLARNSQQNGSPSSMSNSNSAPNLAQLPGAAHPFWWHSRLYPDSGGKYTTDVNIICLSYEINEDELDDRAICREKQSLFVVGGCESSWLGMAPDVAKGRADHSCR